MLVSFETPLYALILTRSWRYRNHCLTYLLKSVQI